MSCIDDCATANLLGIKSFLSQLFPAYIGSFSAKRALDIAHAAAVAAFDAQEKRAEEDLQAANDGCDGRLRQCGESGGQYCADEYRVCKKSAQDGFNDTMARISRARAAELDQYFANVAAPTRIRKDAFATAQQGWRDTGIGFAECVKGCLNTSDVSALPSLGTTTELVPDRVYIGMPIDNGPPNFIDQAIRFHKEEWKLSTLKVPSLLTIISDIGKQAPPEQFRVRIVAHGFPLLSNLNLAMFPGAKTLIDQTSLTALADSDIAIVELMAGLSDLSENKASAIAATIVANLAGGNFGEMNLDEPNGDLAAFIVYATFVVNPKVRRTLTASMKAAILLLRDLYQSRLIENGGVADADLTQLGNALKSISATLDFSFTPPQPVPGQIAWPLNQCVKAVKGGLRDKIDKARAALGGIASIDLRGCDLGTQPGRILEPLAALFGIPAVNVTGPSGLMGFFPINVATPASWEWEQIAPYNVEVTDAWVTEALDKEQQRLGIPDDWAIRIVPENVIETWQTVMLRIKVAAYCDIGFALISVVDRREARVFLAQVGFPAHGNTTLAREVLIRSLWANPKQSRVKAIAKAWISGTVPTIPVIETLALGPDIFPWEDGFRQQIKTGV